MNPSEYEKAYPNYCKSCKGWGMFKRTSPDTYFWTVNVSLYSFGSQVQKVKEWLKTGGKIPRRGLQTWTWE
jgi:hypothetical protein